MTEFKPHPKPSAKPKKPGAMRPNKTRKFTDELSEGAAELLTAARAKGAALPKAPKAAKPKKVAPPKPAAPAGTSKTEMLMGMLTNPGGASSKEMEAATGWAPHSVRGFLGTLRKKGTLIQATKFGKGEPTVYSIEASAPPEPATDTSPAEDPGEVV